MSQDTDWIRFKPLQVRFNSQEDTQIKDYLPIIGNSIPNKKIMSMDNAAITSGAVSLTGDGIMTADYTMAYHSDSCIKIGMVDGDVGILDINFDTPISLSSLSKKTNNYAKIIRTGLGGPARDRLHFVINAMTEIMINNNGDSFEVLPKFYSGNAYADFSGAFTYWGPRYQGGNFWQKMQTDILNSAATRLYHNGFTIDSWNNITKIELTILCSNNTGSERVYFYLQDLYMAIPFNDGVITDAYYPAVSPTYYISQLFGNDTNAGTKLAPLKTLERAAFLNATEVLILDSATYKPINYSGQQVGLQMTLTSPLIIRAAYLETPIISAKAGLFDMYRVGARTTKRNLFQTTGTKRTVSPGGIGAAVIASSNGDIVELSAGNYTGEGVLLSGKTLTFQAAEGTTPTWNVSSGICLRGISGSVISCKGIIFKGAGSGTEKLIKIEDTSILYLDDCTITNAGTNSGSASGIYFATTGTGVHKINNCLVSNNGENFKAIDGELDCSGTLWITNCIGFMGATANNFFIYNDSSASTNAVVFYIYSIGNQITSSTNATLSYYYYNHSGSTNGANFFSLMNDYGNLVRNDGTLNNNNVYLVNDFIHDINYTGGETLLFAYNLSATGANFSILNCIIANIALAGNKIATNSGAGVFNNNIFMNISGDSTLYNTTCNIDNNLFYNCYCATEWNGTNDFGTVNNVIYVNCGTSIRTSSSITINGHYCIYYNSPINQGSGTTINMYNCSQQNPDFIDPDNFNFGWYYDSILETLPDTLTLTIRNVFQNYFINPSGDALSFEFIAFEGFYNTCLISSTTALVTAQYCSMYNSLMGIGTQNAIITIDNCFITGNGIGIRHNNSDPKTINVDKNNIIDSNGTGIMLLAGCDLENNTIINNDYGLSLVFTGFYRQNNYMAQYITLKNNIINESYIYDYVGTLPTDYCVIVNRYYDSLPTTDINYTVTVGPHDSGENADLDPDYLFPANIYLGYKLTSSAFMAGSVPGTNIGARQTVYIKSQPLTDDFTFRKLSDIFGNKNDITPVNLQENTYVNGEYQAYSDKDIIELLISWDTPEAGHTRLMSDEKDAIIFMYKTYWWVSISRDGGFTWSYWKVKKGNALSFESQWNKYVEQPVGNANLSLIPMPDSFDITDYFLNTIDT